MGNDLYTLRKTVKKEVRHFMTLDISSKYWNITAFEDLKVGDRVFYINIMKNNSRSPVFIVHELPQWDKHYGLCCKVSMAQDKNQHGITLKELKNSNPEKNSEFLPLVVRDSKGAERMVMSVSRGILGEIILNV